MLTRFVSRATVSSSVRRVAHSRKAVASRSWNRFVQTTAEDTTGLPEPPKTMKGIPTSAFEILNGMPEDQATRRVYIYRPARNAMQSGNGKVDQWFLQFERNEDRWNNPVMGWVSSRDPLGQMTMKFPDRDAAIRYAEAHGLRYRVEDDWLEEFEALGRVGKNYGDKFKYKTEKPDPKAELEDF